MPTNELFFDTRLQEKSLRDGKLSRSELESRLSELEDASKNMVEYDAHGNPTNLPKRKLKELPIKPEEPQTLAQAAMAAPTDPLREAWDD